MKYIDLASSIKNSNSDFLKKLPGFVIRRLEKLIKQEELNYILDKYKDCEGAAFHQNVIKEFNINESFQFVPNLRPYIALVNPYGMSSKSYVTELEKVYQSDVAITHFPAGEVSRRYHGKIQDRAWQKSFITRAISCNRDIVPFYFHGRNSNLFYGINLVRRALGIKTNIELSLLPRELFLKKNKTVHLKIGKPISWKKFDSTHTHVQWAQKVKDHVYTMSAANGSKIEF